MNTLIHSKAIIAALAAVCSYYAPAMSSDPFESLNRDAKTVQPLFPETNWPESINFWDFAFSPDGKTLFFGTGTNEGEGRTIMMRRWSDGGWSSPEPAPFAMQTAAEGTPVMGGDGNWLYFSSDRHSQSEPDNVQRDLYRVSRVSGWRDVERLTDTPLYGEVTLSTALDGTGFLWTDRRLDGEKKMGLYQVSVSPEGKMTGFQPYYDLHEGDPSGENYAWISPDGSFALFLNYDVLGGQTEEDIYLIRRRGAGWSEPVGIGPGVNTVFNEGSPSISPDGRFLLFGSNRDAQNRYYYLPLTALTLFQRPAERAEP